MPLVRYQQPPRPLGDTFQIGGGFSLGVLGFLALLGLAAFAVYDWGFKTPGR